MTKRYEKVLFVLGTKEGEGRQSSSTIAGNWWKMSKTEKI